MDKPELKALLASCVAGYCAARGNACVQISEADFGVSVTYAPGHGRAHEFFVCDQLSAADFARLQPGDWLTVFGDAKQLLPQTVKNLEHLVDEILMMAGLSRLQGSNQAAEDTLLGPAEIAAFNAQDQLPAFDPADRNVLFAVEQDDLYVATVRYGLGFAGDVVIDRVGTLPDYRRRGYARLLMMAAAAHASEAGHRRAILMSTQEGEPLYRSLGYQAVAPISVFRV